MLNLVTGGAGFLGSHLVNALVDEGERAIIIDNLSTGHVRNLEHALSTGRATFVYANVAVPAAELSDVVGRASKGSLDRIFHLASPASPQAYGADPWGTLAVNGLGTMSLIELALEHGARMLYASTSEVYGDPLVHPQPETYFGNVDPIGPRSCYDEGKRFGEAAMAAASRSRGLDARLVRFFNCYGPGMSEADGRLIPALVDAVLQHKPFPIHGTGRQTRSMTYVDDAIALLRLVMRAPQPVLAPVNVGNDEEATVEEIARTLAAVAGVDYNPVHLPPREQDPQRRKPDLSRAKSLGWAPSTPLRDGLRATFRWFQEARLVYA
jgi:nucleoside-diphosphate-sugar epimerase